MKKGFTLMELMVYMAIVGIIVVVAGQAFSNSTRFRVRTQNMLKATQEVENVASSFKADVSQMGAKSSKEATIVNGEDKFYGVCSAGAVNCIPKDVYMSEAGAALSSGSVGSSSSNEDLSSFRLSASNDQSDLTFRRVRYGTDGKYQAVEEIRWFVDGEKTLKRSCRTVTGTSDEGGCPREDDAAKVVASAVTMATGVNLFKVYPGIPTVKSDASGNLVEQLFPDENTSVFKLIALDIGDNIQEPGGISAGGTDVTITGFARNYDVAEGEIDVNGSLRNEIYVALNTPEADTWSECKSFTLQPGIEYEISFSMTYGNENNSMLLFVAGRDHMSIGFRKKADGSKHPKINDFLFYPPTNDDSQGKRTMRFTVSEQIEDVCLAFTFSTYSPLAGTGSVTISNLKLRKIAGSSYTFGEGSSLKVIDKRNVKAFKLRLQIGRGGKNDPTDNKDKPGETGEIELVVPTPSNGIGI